MTTPKILTLNDLLDLLHVDGEHASINHQAPGHAFTSHILPTEQAAAHSGKLTGANVWYGVNPVQPGTRGRGTAKDITRLAALWVDLDIKEGGMPTWDAAHAVIATLTDMLGTRPTAVVNSGHGLQPLWATDPDDDALTLNTEEKRTHAVALLRRWGRLVTSVAEAHGGAVDSVFDLPRVLRAPGTANHKNPNQPLPVVAVTDTGHPLDADTIDETLTAYGALEQLEDTEQLGETVSPPSSWEWASSTCIYAQKTTAGWTTDTPTERHPWLTSQATRLAALARNGCLTHDDHDKATQTLAARFRQLLTNAPTRQENPGEITGAIRWGRDRVATMTDTRVHRKVGDHPHQFEDIATATTPPPTPTQPPATPTTRRHLTVVPPPTDGATALAIEPEPATGPGRRPAPNEDNTALLLVDRHGHEIRYTSGRGTWLTWNGHKWDSDDDDHIHELTRDIARHLPEGEGWATYKKRALSYNGIRGITSLARSDKRITVRHEHLDAHPYELNTPAGIVDLRTGELRPPDPSRLHTRSTTVAPDFDQPTPRWTKFLTDTFHGNEDVLPFLQRLVGYSATGLVTHHVLPFLHGPGGNGKSVFLDVTHNTLGDYAGSTPSKFLMAGQTQHETEIARLSGLRMAIASEVNQDDKFDEAKVKLLTGGDALTARFMRQDHFTFSPTHHLWLMGNHQPKVTGGGESFWRRLRLIGFNNTVPDHQKVEGLDRILLEEEGPGILAWIINGAVDVIKNGMNPPASVMAATNTYASEEDALARFIDDRCNIGGGDMVRLNTAELRRAYTTWCDAEGEKPMSPQVFGRELRTRYGVEQARSHGRRYYLGIDLYADEEEPEQPEEWWDK